MSTSNYLNKLNMLKRKIDICQKLCCKFIGLSTTYPNKANSLFPIGDYKGYGLGATVEVFAVYYLGCHLEASFTNVYVRYFKKRFISQFYIILRTDFVISNKQFINSIEKMTLEVNKIKSSKNKKYYYQISQNKYNEA